MSLPAEVAAAATMSLRFSSTTLWTLSPTVDLPCFLSRRASGSEREIRVSPLSFSSAIRAALAAWRAVSSSSLADTAPVGAASASSRVSARSILVVPGDLALEGGVLALQLGQGLDARVAGVGVEVAAVDAEALPADQIKLAAQQDELAVGRLERLGVGAAELGDGAVARAQALQEPDDFQVALGFGLQPAAGADAVQIPVEVELEQVGGRVGRLPRREPALGVAQTERRKVEGVDVDVDGPRQAVLAHVVLHARGQEHRLAAVQSRFVAALAHRGGSAALPARLGGFRVGAYSTSPPLSVQQRWNSCPVS